VQWVGETHVTRGERLAVTAAHDTYGLSFRVAAGGAARAADGWRPGPLQASATLQLAAACNLYRSGLG